MGNQNPKPTLSGTDKPSCEVEMLQPKTIEITREVQTKPKVPEVTQNQSIVPKANVVQSKSAVEEPKAVLKQSNQKIYWPQNHVKSIKLPEVKPPAKKIVIKKTKEFKQNGVEEGEIELLSNVATSKSQTIESQNLTSRGKTAPLIKSNDNPLFQFGKTKKCRVSRMV